MKKTLLILLMALCLSLAVSCNDTNNGAAHNDSVTTTEITSGVTGTESVSESAEITEADDKNDNGSVFMCKFENGTEIAISKALPALGEYLDYAEATSCIHPGMDKVYTYNGFTVTTSPDANGNDLVSEVALISDTAVLAGGISIGCDKSVIEDVYGNDYTEEFGVMKYEKDGVIISVVLDNSSKVTSFVISAAQ